MVKQMQWATIGDREKEKNKKIDKDQDKEEEMAAEANCAENFHEYLINSSLHGLKYIGDLTLSFFERFFFGLAFLVVFVMSAYFISNVWQKWSETPIIIGLNPVATPLKDIPFPAVTICNMNQARNSAVKNIQPGSLDESLLESVCARTDQINATAVSSSSVGKWSYFRTFLRRVSQPCEDMLRVCRFATRHVRCMEIFQMTLTDEGVCCTFNSVHPKLLLKTFQSYDDLDTSPDNDNLEAIDWTPERGFTNMRVTNASFPRAAAGAGSHMGLTIVLDAQVHEYHCSSTSSAGFKILVHNPTETPKISNFGFSVSVGEETRVVINPRISDASELIRRVPIQQRQCVFASEGNLSYFRTYSKKNCEMECESRLIQESCSCVLYFMPKENNDTRICSRLDAACYEPIKLAIELANNVTFSCICMPGCFEINYGKELSKSSLGNGGLFMLREQTLMNENMSYVRRNYALVHIFFMETSFRSYTKGELIGFTEFLSNTGGLLGLFMGFSVLSLVEIFYFLSLRPYCARKRYRKHHQHDDREPNNGRLRQDSFALASNRKTITLGNTVSSTLRRGGNGAAKERRRKNQRRRTSALLTKYLRYVSRQVGTVGHLFRSDPLQARYPYCE